MGEYFQELKSLRGKVKVELDLSNYATKKKKNVTGIDTSSFSKKIDLGNLPNLKSNVDKLDK